MYSFGWWSTGRDIDALNLFDTVFDACEKGVIKGGFSYCFISRDPGESHHSDQLVERIRKCEIPVVTLSAARFMPELRSSDRSRWRELYHRQVLERIRPFSAETVVLAGYMWVVSPEVCNAFPVINLHPAAPDGPAGTWQEVIWQLIEQGAGSTGVMMHLVTPELDKGPPVSFCRFPIKGGSWDRLWDDCRARLQKAGSLDALKENAGEALPLFAEIRRQGVRRELPLMVQTLRALADGEFSIVEGVLRGRDGKELEGPWDLTDDIERELR